MNIFEFATRRALRFPSKRGLLTTEQLWELPLTASDNMSLDGVARAANASLKEFNEESFVTPKPTAGKQEAQVRLDIVKHIIQVKLEEAEKARTAKARAEERQRLLAIMGDKQEAELRGLSMADLQKRLDELAE